MKTLSRNLIAVCLLTGVCLADDWPHWMGPSRDNVWHETGLIDSFPEGGLKVLWRTKIASGYSGPAVVGDSVFITDYQTSDKVLVSNFERQKFSGVERTFCLDRTTGEQKWKHEYPVKYSVSYPSGPRCTPTVDGDRVYTLGAEGHLFCFNADNGDVIWKRELKEDYNTKSALWGYAAHPLIDGDNLLTLAGGEGSHIVALDKMTGAENWKAQSAPEQGYSPPTIIEAGGTRQLILLKPNAVASVSPDDGKEYWSVPYKAQSGSIIMSPLLSGEYLYVAGYSKKSLLLKMDQTKPAATEVWRDKTDAISPVNVQPFLDGDVVYGFHENGMLKALKLPEGKQLWQTPEPISKRPQGSGTAFLVKQGERFWLFNELGELVIAELTEDGYSEIDRAKVIEPSNVAFGRKVVWSMPAFANQCAYIRNDNEIICVSLAK